MSMEKFALVGQCPLFAELTLPEQEHVARIAFEKVYPRESVIFKEGEAGDAFYLVGKGAVRISTNVPGVGEEALAVLKEGEGFGEMSLIDDGPRTGSAIAHEGEVLLLAIYKHDFRALLERDQGIGSKLLWAFVRMLVARLRDADEKLKGVYALARSS
jgi:CRP/FNR family cyclic AMP-dependent transcriptional regulator